VHANFPAGIADGADDAGNNRADGRIGMEQGFEDALRREWLPARSRSP
jgi:hypothetical protein